MAKNHNSRVPVSAKQPESEPKTFRDALQSIREDAKAKGTDKLTMREINAEIAAVRHAEKAKRKQIVRANERSPHRG